MRARPRTRSSQRSTKIISKTLSRLMEEKPKEQIVRTVEKTIIESGADTSRIDEMKGKSDTIQNEIEEVFKRHGLEKAKVRMVAFEFDGHLSCKLQGKKRDMLLALLAIGESID